MVIEVRLSQEENASSPIVVTLGGMVMDVRLEHPENAEPPIAVTLGGMVMDVRLLQSENKVSLFQCAHTNSQMDSLSLCEHFAVW